MAPLLRWGVAIIVFVDVVFYGSSVEVGNMKLCEISILVFAVVFCGFSDELMRWGIAIIVFCCCCVLWPLCSRWEI